MTAKKISELPVASSVTGADLVPVVQGGVTKQATSALVQAPSVPKALVDAKGDLLVGTADDTVGRLGVGTDGQVLTADSTQATGAKWAAAAGSYAITKPAVTYQYFSMGGKPSTSANHNLFATGVLVAIPVYLPAGTYGRIGVNVTTVGTSTWRLGVYGCSGTTNLPDSQAPLYDAGTIDMSTTTGIREIIGNFTITTSGIYWPSVLCTAYTSSPTTTTFDYDSTWVPPVLGTPTYSNNTRNKTALYLSGQGVGALPTLPAIGSLNFNDGCPKIIVGDY